MSKINVFVSWSGSRSERLAHRLGEWLPGIVPDMDLFFSSAIPAGADWWREIERAIQKAHFAILCVTQENLNSPWLNFEAGALWRASKTGILVCPLLLELAPSELTGPLSAFQAKRFEEKPFKELCKTLAKHTKMDADRLRYNFEAFWPKLHKDVTDDIKQLPKTPKRRSA